METSKKIQMILIKDVLTTDMMEGQSITPVTLSKGEVFTISLDLSKIRYKAPAYSPVRCKHYLIPVSSLKPYNDDC